MNDHFVSRNEERRLPPWKERPFEIAYLLNPAFCMLALNEAVRSYQQVNPKGSGMPYPMSFLVLPVILHQRTRELLPKRITRDLYNWIQENPIVYSGYASRVRRLVPLNKEAIIFGMQRHIIGVERNGDLISLRELDDRELNLSAYVESASLIGRWFAGAGSAETIFRMWRIKP